MFADSSRGFRYKKHPRTRGSVYEGVRFQFIVNCSTLNTRSNLLERIAWLPVAKVLARCRVVSDSSDALGICSLSTDDMLLTVYVQAYISLAAFSACDWLARSREMLRFHPRLFLHPFQRFRRVSLARRQYVALIFACDSASARCS
jgi:hypothetical protein